MGSEDDDYLSGDLIRHVVDEVGTNSDEEFFMFVQSDEFAKYVKDAEVAYGAMFLQITNPTPNTYPIMILRKL